jgi:5-methylcytosine-specific restriction protein A
MFASEVEPVTLAQLVARRRELDALEAEWLGMVATYDRSGQAQVDGYLGAAAALRDACLLDSSTAAAHVKRARKLEQLPATTRAFADGAISRRHAQVIANAFTPEREAALSEVEPILAQTAKHVVPKELLRVVRYTTDALDGDDGAAADAAEHASRALHISTTLGGIAVLDGRLAADQAEIVMTAIDEEIDRARNVNETRNPAQRRADALVSICRRSLDNGELGGSRKARPHLTVVVDLERLDGTADLISDARIEAAHVGRLSKATLDRIACDCSVSRVLMNGRSEVIDVGRATRTISPALWRALVARDRHCTHPGCDKSPGWCEVHPTSPGSTAVRPIPKTADFCAGTIITCTTNRDHRRVPARPSDELPRAARRRSRGAARAGAVSRTRRCARSARSAAARPRRGPGARPGDR